KIYTLGTSTRKLEEFIRVLKFYNIQAVVDVRRFPTSKWEHFKKENISLSLKRERIKYFYLGRELGGYRKGGYEEYLKTLDFQKGLEMLEKIASNLNSAILCAERLPWRCHRIFIAEKLQEKGWRVIHIIEEKRCWESLL
ncbi:DUF488 domain-containing protein, partial [Candidatus Aerophobetes bacterium]|nr:DUF488 domain-containing protein [Candidatus Aerophobetes bacterium]